MANLSMHFQDHLHKRLPNLILRVFKDYEAFLNLPAPKAHDDFSKWQKACRDSLSHLEKLITLVSFLGGHAAQDNGWLDLITQAKTDINDRFPPVPDRSASAPSSSAGS